MKHRLLLLLLAALGLVGCAGETAQMGPMIGPETPWAEIRGTPNTLIKAPQVRFGTTGLSVLDLCRQDDRFRGRTSSGQQVETPVRDTPQSYTVQVVRITQSMHDYGEIPLFTKQYTIPACGESAK